MNRSQLFPKYFQVSNFPYGNVYGIRVIFEYYAKKKYTPGII